MGRSALARRVGGLCFVNPQAFQISPNNYRIYIGFILNTGGAKKIPQKPNNGAVFGGFFAKIRGSCYAYPRGSCYAWITFEYCINYMFYMHKRRGSCYAWITFLSSDLPTEIAGVVMRTLMAIRIIFSAYSFETVVMVCVLVKATEQVRSLLPRCSLSGR